MHPLRIDTPPFQDALSRSVAVTDLLTTISFPPAEAPDVLDGPAAPAASGDGATRPFAIEFPGLDVPGVGSPAAPTRPTPAGPTESVPSTPAVFPTVPSYAILVIGGLVLMCLALTAALATSLSAPAERPEPVLTVGRADRPAPPPEPPAVATAVPASFPAEPVPIPVELLTQLEAASEQPLDVELTRLLDAIQYGFGTRSARLEPTLRSYVYRMSSRFEWNPGSFRVAVSAPTADLAEARSALLADLFPDAVAAGRLRLATTVGPHTLTLVTE